jgi:hypothetical protein|tara:strand:- start:317 stop:634 length:318 start_codon:yes stop_codon:yes gene_type:complete
MNKIGPILVLIINSILILMMLFLIPPTLIQLKSDSTGLFIFSTIIFIGLLYGTCSFTYDVYKDFKKDKRKRRKVVWGDMDKLQSWQIVIYFILFGLVMAIIMTYF